jgi:hypothetical protein
LEIVHLSWSARLLTAKNLLTLYNATFAIWTTVVGDRESYELRVSRRVGNTWTPAETLANENMFFIKYDLAVHSDGSAMLIWANGPTYALQFTPGKGWSERRVLSNGYWGNRYDHAAGNDKGVVAVTWREDFTLHATVYTPEFGWVYSQVIMDDLSLGSNNVSGILVTPEGEVFVIARRGNSCGILYFARYKAVSGWSESEKVNGDHCTSEYSRGGTWLNGGRNLTTIFGDRWMTKFE